MPFNILAHGIQNVTGLAEGIFFGRGLSTNAIPVQFESALGRTVTTEATGAPPCCASARAWVWAGGVRVVAVAGVHAGPQRAARGQAAPARCTACAQPP